MPDPSDRTASPYDDVRVYALRELRDHIEMGSCDDAELPGLLQDLITSAGEPNNPDVQEEILSCIIAGLGLVPSELDLQPILDKRPHDEAFLPTYLDVLYFAGRKYWDEVRAYREHANAAVRAKAVALVG
jgi:hypothetical protein